jgi:hypothetical protein
MIIEQDGAKYNVPDHLIDDLKLEFEEMRKEDDRERLVFLRNSIILITALLKKKPRLADDPDFCKDMIHALAVREALKHHNMLYDS